MMAKITPPRTHVHFDLQTGEIVSIGNSTPPQARLGCGVVFLNGASSPDFGRQKVDVATRQIVNKSATEIAAAHQPTTVEVAALVSVELSNTDQFMMVDRPMSDERRSAWMNYRQALRDLSKLNTVADQIASWPTRPDGVDAAATLLRTRT